MAKRRITQETFDATVRENMEEFDMEPDEALKEAVEQFESQGNQLKERIRILNCGFVRGWFCMYCTDNTGNKQV